MDSTTSNGMRIETTFEEYDLIRVVFFLPGGRMPNTMFVSVEMLDETLERIHEAGRNAQTAEEEHQIPESMFNDYEPQASDTCSICLEEEGGDETASWISLARCKHRFHAHCIRNWQRSMCPYCREKYPTL